MGRRGGALGNGDNYMVAWRWRGEGVAVLKGITENVSVCIKLEWGSKGGVERVS